MRPLAYWSSGLAVVQARHFHGMIHEPGGMAADKIADGCGNAGIAIQQGAAHALLERCRDFADRKIEAISLVAGEGVPLDGQCMFDRRQPSKRIQCGVDEVVGRHEAILNLARYASGPRVAPSAERPA